VPPDELHDLVLHQGTGVRVVVDLVREARPDAGAYLVVPAPLELVGDVVRFLAIVGNGVHVPTEEKERTGSSGRSRAYEPGALTWS
jgi:hypothetical protein